MASTRCLPRRRLSSMRAASLKPGTGRNVCISPQIPIRRGNRTRSTSEHRDALDVLRQRERVEDPEFLDGVSVTEVQADIAGEGSCLTTDMDDPGHFGGGQQIDHLTARAG